LYLQVGKSFLGLAGRLASRDRILMVVIVFPQLDPSFGVEEEKKKKRRRKKRRRGSNLVIYS